MVGPPTAVLTLVPSPKLMLKTMPWVGPLMENVYVSGWPGTPMVGPAIEGAGFWIVNVVVALAAV